MLLEYFSEGHCGDSAQGCSRDQAEQLFLKVAELHAQWWEHPALTELGWAKQYAEKGLDRLPEIFQKLATGPSTLVHGDMQLDNIWFGLRDAPIAFFDWQLTQRAQPGWDIAWFFNYSYLPEMRRQDEDSLLAAYIERLHELGVDDYSLASLREYMALSSLFMIVLTPLNVADLDYSSERAEQNLLLSIRRCLIMLEDYGVGGVF